MKNTTNCTRCGRRLTSLSSRSKGIGPECERKAAGGPLRPRRARRTPTDTDTIVPYDGGLFWAQRKSAPTLATNKDGQLELRQAKHEASGLRTNIPRLVYRHSPDGFNFGYGGSGAADLALNLLLFVCSRTKDAERLYQKFKRRFIAGATGVRLEVRPEEVEAWLRENGAEFKIRT